MTSRPGSCSAPGSGSRRCSCISARPTRHDRRDDHDPVRLDLRDRPLVAAARRSRSGPSRSAISRLLPPAPAQLGQPELAAARGIPVRLVGASTCSRWPSRSRSAAVTIGAILSTALLIGPAADRAAADAPPRPRDRRRRRGSASARPGSGSCSPTTATTGRPHHGWPVSFFVVTLVLIAYLARAVRPARPARLKRACSPASWSTRGSSATIVAVVGGAVGFFIVLRGSAFVAHAIPNGSFAGAPPPA